MKQANLNLSYTNITSPMNGRIGKVNISTGNYVTASSGAIAQIYSANPMKVIFPLNSGDFIELKKYYKAASEEERNDESLLVPGDYAKVTIRINSPYKVVMIPQSATKTDVGTGYYVWFAAGKIS